MHAVPWLFVHAPGIWLSALGYATRLGAQSRSLQQCGGVPQYLGSPQCFLHMLSCCGSCAVQLGTFSFFCHAPAFRLFSLYLFSLYFQFLMGRLVVTYVVSVAWQGRVIGCMYYRCKYCMHKSTRSLVTGVHALESSHSSPAASASIALGVCTLCCAEQT